MKDRANHKTRFKPSGVGTKNHQQPISVMYPSDIDALLRSLANRSEYIRDAVIKQLREDGLLQPDRDSDRGAA